MPGGVSPYHQMPLVPGTSQPDPEKLTVPPVREKDDKDKDKEKDKNKDKDKDGASINRAKLIVELPTDAKLYIDDQPMKTPSGRRVFNTPPLQPGQTYYYILRAEVVRDGQRKVSEQRIIIRPGQEARATFANLEVPATTTVQAPAK
jgi:uncharacterized protein (TIGR03000 family)